jgi:hypothetical protein
MVEMGVAIAVGPGLVDTGALSPVLEAGPSEPVGPPSWMTVRARRWVAFAGGAPLTAVVTDHARSLVVRVVLRVAPLEAKARVWAAEVWRGSCVAWCARAQWFPRSCPLHDMGSSRSVLFSGGELCSRLSFFSFV